jgi:hypothetical protein
LHNFLRIHDQTDDARDLGDNTLTREGSSSSANFAQNDVVEPHEIAPEELGMQITDEERARASDRRDRIAKQMWEDYQVYLAEHREE